eukprot:789538-Rhodomonas_salina.3
MRTPAGWGSRWTVTSSQQALCHTAVCVSGSVFTAAGKRGVRNVITAAIRGCVADTESSESTQILVASFRHYPRQSGCPSKSRT